MGHLEGEVLGEETLMQAEEEAEEETEDSRKIFRLLAVYRSSLIEVEVEARCNLALRHSQEVRSTRIHRCVMRPECLRCL